VAPLPLGVTSGRGRYRYTSREVLDGPIDEGQDRSLECFDILTLLVLQEPERHIQRGALTIKKSRLRESAQGDKWSFCLTAGKIWPANQERA
jgi:hypothetical protein